MKRTRAFLAFFAAMALLALAANAGQTGLGGGAHLAASTAQRLGNAAAANSPALLASVQPSGGPTPCTLPSPCTYGCSAGDATIMRYWVYQEKHVWKVGQRNKVSISVPAASRSRSGLGGGWYLVGRVACSRYGVHGYARIEGLSVSSPSVSVSCSPDCGRIDSITATASGGHISFTVVGTGPYGFGWASQSEVVCIHQNSGGGGGGGGQNPPPGPRGTLRFGSNAPASGHVGYNGTGVAVPSSHTLDVGSYSLWAENFTYSGPAPGRPRPAGWVYL